MRCSSDPIFMFLNGWNICDARAVQTLKLRGYLYYIYGTINNEFVCCVSS